MTTPATPTEKRTRRVEILRIWEDHTWDTKVYVFDLEPGQNEPDDEAILAAVNADAYDILAAYTWNLDPDEDDEDEEEDEEDEEEDEEDEEEDEEDGDDMCDYCYRSRIQISHTLDGKTICDECLADRTPDPNYEEVELETVEIQVDALRVAALMRTITPEDLHMRYEGHPVTGLVIHLASGNPDDDRVLGATVQYNTVIGDFDTLHEVQIALDTPVIYVTVPKE
jgi:hypothetical protein